MTQPNLGDPLGVNRNSDEIALIDLNNADHPMRYRYADLEAHIDSVVIELRQRQLPANSRIGIFAQNSVHYLASYLGIMRAGFIVVPINTKLPAKTIRFICQDSEINLALSENALREAIPEQIDVIDIETITQLHQNISQKPDIYCPEATETALILYTSGSTGRPKGVVLSHESQWTMIRGAKKAGSNSLFHKKCGVVAAPMFHMNALFFVAAFLSEHGTVVMLPKFDAKSFIEAISTYNVNMITGVPTMVALMSRDKDTLENSDLSSVENIFIGSAPLTQAIIDQATSIMPNALVMNSYGTTEVGGGLFGVHPDALPCPVQSIGHPLPHTEMRLIGESDNMGVLEIKTPSAMTEYLNLPDLTKAKIKEGWINTGDIFRRDENGFFYFISRADDMFVCNGENIYPGEIEKILDTNNSILQSCVVPVEDEVRGNMPVAFVVRRLNSDLTEDQVKKHVLDNAPAYLHPRHVFFLESLPLAGTNKVDRNFLMKEAVRHVKTLSS